MTHLNPGVRGSWDAHAVEAWYRTKDYYRCYRVWVWKMRAEHTTDTLTWLSSALVMPITSSVDRAMAVTQDLTAALRYLAPASPLAPFNNT